MKLYSRLDSDLKHAEANTIAALGTVEVLHILLQGHPP
jgi:hypothetical protein